MVLLDKDAVVQTETMVLATAAAHGVFLRQPQPRNGLARIEDNGARAAYRINVGTRARGDAGKCLQKIESRALAGQNRPRRSFDLAQRPSRRESLRRPVPSRLFARAYPAGEIPRRTTHSRTGWRLRRVTTCPRAPLDSRGSGCAVRSPLRRCPRRERGGRCR